MGTHDRALDDADHTLLFCYFFFFTDFESFYCALPDSLRNLGCVAREKLESLKQL
jgi:hypothetical protein